MEPRDENDAVWAETVDGGLLRQLFGFYPTLHDAVIRTIAYNRTADELEMTVDYEDEAEGEKPLKARISISWTGVKSMHLGLIENYILGLNFSKDHHTIVTHIRTLDGLDGVVVSDSVEARLVAMDPKEKHDGQPLEFRLI